MALKTASTPSPAAIVATLAPAFALLPKSTRFFTSITTLPEKERRSLSSPNDVLFILDTSRSKSPKSFWTGLSALWSASMASWAIASFFWIIFLFTRPEPAAAAPPPAHRAPPTAESMTEDPKVKGAKAKPVATRANPPIAEDEPAILATLTLKWCFNISSANSRKIRTVFLRSTDQSRALTISSLEAISSFSISL